MTNSNRIKLTWISFFSYALTGALVILHLPQRGDPDLHLP